jgi:hypothetical protein
LQFKEGKEQLGRLPIDMHVEELGAHFDVGDDGFVDAAAVLEAVDLVITCDTALAHLAGAIGRPVWIALNQAPEWRWQRDRGDSVWYPTATLFRQDTADDWDGVFSRMARALEQMLETRESSTEAVPCVASKPRPRVEVSWGELLDKVTVLEIKAERLSCPHSVDNVRQEMDHLKSIIAQFAPLPEDVESKRAALRVTNEKLWDVENAIRASEAEQRFDEQFIALARNIYVLNDERSRLKRAINLYMNSSFIEEKEYHYTSRLF